jgi:hypothetical protein
MKGADLFREMLSAARSANQQAIDRLRSLGVRPEALAYVQPLPFGVVRAEPAGGGLYQPCDLGPPHLVMPVTIDGELVDLLAFRAADPGGWMLRTGQGWCLGLERGVGCLMDDGPVLLHRTPLDWMRADLSGICVTDWDAVDDIRSLDVLPHLVTDCHATADNLRRAMARPVRTPAISVRGALAHAC